MITFVFKNLKKRGLVGTFDKEIYGFKPQIDGSQISIEIDGYCSPNVTKEQCHILFAFSIGDEEYMVFITDLDKSGYRIQGSSQNSRKGIYVYPNSNESIIASGNASTIYPSFDDVDNNYWNGRLSHWKLGNYLAGNDADNYQRLTNIINNENFPLKFEFINNDISDTFQFKFSSPTFSGNNALTCTYYSSVLNGKDFKMYISPDVNDETIIIKTITVNGYVFIFFFFFYFT